MADLLHEKLAEEYPNTMVLISRGLFFNAFNDSAFVLSELMNYKVNKTNSDTYKAGFPYESLEKIKNVCMRECVNFVAFNGDTVVDNATFSKNRFEEFCRRFDVSKIEVSTDKKKKSESEITTKKEKSNEVLHDPQQKLVIHEDFVVQKTVVLYGEGRSVENVVYKIKDQLDEMIDAGKEIVACTFLSSADLNANKSNLFIKNTEKQTNVELCALVVYNHKTRKR